VLTSQSGRSKITDVGWGENCVWKLLLMHRNSMNNSILFDECLLLLRLLCQVCLPPIRLLPGLLLRIKLFQQGWAVCIWTSDGIGAAQHAMNLAIWCSCHLLYAAGAWHTGQRCFFAEGSSWNHKKDTRSGEA
jgi:hypothetical protein